MKSLAKFIFLFAFASIVCILISPILIPLIIFPILPLLTVLICALLTDAKGTIATLLEWYRWYNLLVIRLKGSNVGDENLKFMINGYTWNSFCRVLASASTSITAGPTDPQTQAEGYRFLARVTRAALGNFLEYSDCNAPELHSLVGENIKMGADNPDNLYQSCPLSGAFEYRICGTRGTVKYIGFATHQGHYGKHLSLPPIAHLNDGDLIFKDKTPKDKKDSKGNLFNSNERYFEIILSPNKPQEKDVNWLETKQDEDMTLIVRQTFGYRTRETRANLKLERYFTPEREKEEYEKYQARVGYIPEYPEKYKYALSRVFKPTECTPVNVSDALSQASSLVVGASMFFSGWAKKMANDPSYLNQLPLFDPRQASSAGGDPNIIYYHSYFKLAPHEALMIEAKMPEICLYWNFQLDNYWMESLDYRFYPIHINSDLAVYLPNSESEKGSKSATGQNDDPMSDNSELKIHHKNRLSNNKGNGKTFIICVCHDEVMYEWNLLPKEYQDIPLNWLSTAGHEMGTMCFRWVCAKDFAQPKCRVVKLFDRTLTNFEEAEGLTRDISDNANNVDTRKNPPLKDSILNAKFLKDDKGKQELMDEDGSSIVEENSAANEYDQDHEYDQDQDQDQDQEHDNDSLQNANEEKEETNQGKSKKKHKRRKRNKRNEKN